MNYELFFNNIIFKFFLLLNVVVECAFRSARFSFESVRRYGFYCEFV